MVQTHQNMKKLLWFLSFIILIGISCQSDRSKTEQKTNVARAESPKKVKPTLICETVSLNDTLPIFEVFALIEESKMKIADVNNCDAIAAKDFGQYQIPAQAINAVGGWWAGSGDYFYIIEEGKELAVYQGSIDEMQEENDYGYEKVITFSLKK